MEVETAYLELERLVARYRLPERTLGALFDATSGLRVRRAVYRAILENQSDDPVSEQTATRDLQSLTNHGLLVAHGERRGRDYTAGPELAAIRERVTVMALRQRSARRGRHRFVFHRRRSRSRQRGRTASRASKHPRRRRSPTGLSPPCRSRLNRP